MTKGQIVAVLLAVLGAGMLGASRPSMAQMMGGMGAGATSEVGRNAIQQTIESARDRKQKSSAPASNDANADRPSKTVQTAKRESSEQKKAPAQKQAGRPPGGTPVAGGRYVPDEIVLEVAANTDSQQIDALARRLRLVWLDSFNFDLGGTVVVRLRIQGGRSVPTVLRAIQNEPSVLFSQPNYLFTLVEEVEPSAASGPNPAADQDLLEKMHLPQAHHLARGDKVLVAVIDSGVDTTHPDLAGDIADTFDAIGTGEPVHSHGTAVAGGIAAHGRLTGAAPAAQVLAIRAFSGKSGADDGTSYAIMKGLDWAVAHGARVINMSFAGPQDPGITRGVAAAYNKGVVLVAAAGNKGADSPALFPAADRHVIAVTSTDKNDQLPAFANRGSYVAVAAPGVDLPLIAPNNSMQRKSGTSFSSAYVTGTVALMLQRKPQLAPDAVRQALMSSAKHLGAKPVDDQTGGGLVDAYQAILTVAPEVSSETTVTPAASRQ
jgi:subtilisin family serine protease